IPGEYIVSPAKRPHHLKVKKKDKVVWRNNTAGRQGVNLILPNWALDVFEQPFPLVSTIPPNSPSQTFTVKDVASTFKGFHYYHVYVIDAGKYAKGGSEPEMEVK